MVAANINYEITRNHNDLCYLDMESLSILSEGDKTDGNGKPMPLCRDHVTYKPIRNAMGHTSLLTNDAKNQLKMTLANIKGRLNTLLKKVNPS